MTSTPTCHRVEELTPSPRVADLPPATLASASPRRIELMQRLVGSVIESVVVRPASIDEGAVAAQVVDPTPSTMVAAVARAKHDAVRLDAVGQLVAADTVVVGPGGDAIGKPTDRNHAHRLLTAFSGATITVLTGLVVGSHPTEVIASTVSLRPVAADEIGRYLDTGAGDDKAGGLELQGRAHHFIDSVDGCWSNVIGLPLCRVAHLVGDAPDSRCGDLCGCWRAS